MHHCSRSLFEWNAPQWVSYPYKIWYCLNRANGNYFSSLPQYSWLFKVINYVFKGLTVTGDRIQARIKRIILPSPVRIQDCIFYNTRRWRLFSPFTSYVLHSVYILYIPDNYSLMNYYSLVHYRAETSITVSQKLVSRRFKNLLFSI